MIVKIKVKHNGASDTSENSIEVGTAKHLFGKVHVLSIFVGRESSPWGKKDIANTLENLQEAQRWLKIQSARFGKTLCFVNTIFGEEYPICDNTIPDSYESDNAYYYACSLIQRIGFGDNSAYIEWWNGLETS